ncbi:MAG: ATP-binding protein [Halothiobacillaceae bacterium]
MQIELWALSAVGLAYLASLFLIAHAGDRGWLPARWVRHPLTYVLSLGVYATAWTYYGSVGFAAEEGYAFLTIYLGVTLAFGLAPLLLWPILQITREYQLTSLADLLAFRYRHRLTGVLVTLFTLIGVLPYISLQVKAVTESVLVLSRETPPAVLALGFCVTLSVFAILFGARHLRPREKHAGLVVAMAFESLVKLVAILAVGLLALFGLFGGPGGLADWLAANPEMLDRLQAPARTGEWFSLVLLAFAAAFLLPRQFHMTFTENIDPATLRTAAWAFPLFLLLLNLPIPVIFWAGESLGLALPPDYYLLGVAASGPAPELATFLGFIGGLSAASAMVIVTTLALSSMCLNHLVLPALRPGPEVDLYRWLTRARRLLIVVILAAGYGFYSLLENRQGLVELGLMSFVAVAQFLPGVVGLLYWRRATGRGFIAGLAVGILAWVILLILPLMAHAGLIGAAPDVTALQALLGLERWSLATFVSLSLNTLTLALVSLLDRQTEAEERAAIACTREPAVTLPEKVRLQTPEQFEERLARALGPEVAAREVRQALRDLDLDHAERRPTALGLLRERIERNLSGLLGPGMAHMIVTEGIELAEGQSFALAETVRHVESRLEVSRNRLRGLAAELDSLRRYHRQVLHELPLGVCSVSAGHKVVTWNTAMARITGVADGEVTDRRIEDLPPPWAGMLRTFLANEQAHLYKLQLQLKGQSRWFNLHKSAIEPVGTGFGQGAGGTVILVEDLTSLHNLEREVAHSDRLASIGRLAAGVAHEIGNPLAGIASMAQNLHYESEREAIDETAETILAQTRRITRIVQSLVNFSHAGDVADKRFVSLDLRPVVDEAIELIRLDRQATDLVIDNHVPDGLRVQGDRQGLSQVLINLLSNAIDASSPGQSIRVSGRELPDGRPRLEVTDQGPGIDETLRDRVFEPFFTTKPAGRGTGLGLSLVYSIVRDHGGQVFVETPVAGGTRMVIVLPAAASVPA